jgi:hypothetical protein
LLAIYENVYKVNLFPYRDELLILENLEDFDFRSSALLGHPLANAMCISTIMGFILVSSFKQNIKFGLLLLGYIAILCFNARGTIIVWTVLGVVFLAKSLLQNKTRKTTKFLITISALFIILLISYLSTKYGLGGRLIHSELMDDSAKTRLEVFKAFSYINNIDFWYGNPSNYFKIMNNLGAGGVENSVIVMIINYGILITIVLIAVLIIWIKKLINHYSFPKILIILLSFVVVGSMSNGLSGPMPWIFFLLCANSFPAIDKLIMRRKAVQLRAAIENENAKKKYQILQ